MNNSGKKFTSWGRVLMGGAAVVSLYLASIAIGRRDPGSDSTAQARASIHSAKPENAAPRAATGVSGPVLSILTADLQLDLLQPGKSQEVEVSVRNDGTAPLKLDSISLDAGCEVTRLPGKDISPGEAAAIGLRITATPETSGLIRTLKLHSNASGAPGTVTVRSTAASPVVSTTMVLIPQNH